MEKFYWVIVVAVTMFVITMVVYRVIPTRQLPKSRPGMAFFPKYYFDITDLDRFRENLGEEGFKEVSPNCFTRGSHIGDFSAKAAKLEVKIDESGKTATLCAPVMAIGFDTGDLWDVADGLLQD